jgi:hypothetical protein
VHPHSCNHDGSNASRDAEGPIDSGIHGCVRRRREERLRVLFGVWNTKLLEEKGDDDEACCVFCVLESFAGWMDRRRTKADDGWEKGGWNEGIGGRRECRGGGYFVFKAVWGVR